MKPKLTGMLHIFFTDPLFIPFCSIMCCSLLRIALINGRTGGFFRILLLLKIAKGILSLFSYVLEISGKKQLGSPGKLILRKRPEIILYLHPDLSF